MARGPTPIVEGVTFGPARRVHRPDGRNGAGKSTLMDLVAGLRAAAEGSIVARQPAAAAVDRARRAVPSLTCPGRSVHAR